MADTRGWMPIETAPRDGTAFVGRRSYADRLTGRLKYEKHRTRWGKASHVPLYGWSYCARGNVEDCTLWQPTHWSLPQPPEAEK
jgi:hypothetical protein